MDTSTLNKLRKKGFENGITIFQVDDNYKSYKIHYYDDINMEKDDSCKISQKLIEKIIDVNAITSVDEIIDKIKLKSVKKRIITISGKGYELFDLHDEVYLKVNPSIRGYVVSVQTIPEYIVQINMNGGIVEADGIMLEKIKETQKSPVGIKPHLIWIDQRIDEIIKAMDRYREARKEIPKEWYFELAHLEVYKNTKAQNTRNLTINTNEITKEAIKELERSVKNSYICNA